MPPNRVAKRGVTPRCRASYRFAFMRVGRAVRIRPGAGSGGWPLWSVLKGSMAPKVGRPRGISETLQASEAATPQLDRILRARWASATEVGTLPVIEPGGRQAGAVTQPCRWRACAFGSQCLAPERSPEPRPGAQSPILALVARDLRCAAATLKVRVALRHPAVSVSLLLSTSMCRTAQ